MLLNHVLMKCHTSYSLFGNWPQLLTVIAHLVIWVITYQLQSVVVYYCTVTSQKSKALPIVYYSNCENYTLPAACTLWSCTCIYIQLYSGSRAYNVLPSNVESTFSFLVHIHGTQYGLFTAYLILMRQWHRQFSSFWYPSSSHLSEQYSPSRRIPYTHRYFYMHP